MGKSIHHLVSSLLCMGLAVAEEGTAQAYFVEDGPVVGARFPGLVSAFGDYDNDGRADVFVSGELFGPRTALLHNDGSGRFAECAAAIPRESSSKWKGGGAFGDYDNDGDLDLFIAVGQGESAGRNVLLRNERGVFVEATERYCQVLWMERERIQRFQAAFFISPSMN